MKWRSEVVLAVTLFSSVAPSVAVAQATAPSPLCACFVGKTPGTVVPGVPGVPGTVPPPETVPGEGGSGQLPPKGDGDRAPWAFLGAAGLVLLSGVPFGGGGVQGPLFGMLPTGMGGLDGPGQAGSAPTTPIERAGVTELTPSPGDAGGSALPPAGAGGGDPVSPRSAVDSALATPRLGFVPPKTATHLPLFGAIGVLMTAAGLFLARRSERQRRRRRRLIAA